ncbi:MAG: type I-E CRISPR-associated protein Cas6/Cse3/CasE [Dermatophilus congolensis]|nr:type I-E CRISPR-associated protein Cas6/Cse3/CasE [Dermatophilus congolensis]
MYLSRFQLNPAREGTRRLLGSPQRMHAAVMAAYPAGVDVRPLWRLDSPSRHEYTLYIVGAARPDLTHLVEQAGWPTTATWDTTTYGEFLGRLQAEQTWRFRLTANPVRVIPAGEGERGKVVPCSTEADQQQWLRDKSARWGFTLAGSPNGVRVTGRVRDEFNRREVDGSARRRVTISRARFDGVLTVTDPEALRAAMTGGMGRAKAYGCGLMTLARPR